MDQIRIVIADDHPFLRAGLRLFCNSQDEFVVVGEAEDGEDAVRLTRELRPDVLLLDLYLPRLGGVAVALEVRAAAPQTRILVFTGYASDLRLARSLLNAGVHGYLVKTAGFRELGAVLRRIHHGDVYVDPAIARDLRAEMSPPSAEPTSRELDVLGLVADGKRDSDVARLLDVSEATVRFHVKNLFTKLHAANRTDMVQRARDRGWIPDRELGRRTATSRK